MMTILDPNSTFRFDEILNQDDICNLNREKRELEKAVTEKKKIIVYGRRNSGKTSVVKSFTIPYFCRKHVKSFVLFADLMEAKDISSLSERLHRAFEVAFSEAFPAKFLMKKAIDLLGTLRPQLTFDELSGKPVITIEARSSKKILSIEDIFKIIQEKIVPQFDVLIALDEFQDIAFVPEAQGILRNCFQQLGRVPMILMGSKQHMLSDLFAKPRAPLARFGEDLAFGLIPYNEFHEYMSNRFKSHKIRISLEASKELQDLLFRDAEAINIVCQSFISTGFQGAIQNENLRSQIAHVISVRSSRFETYLAQFSEKEQRVLGALAQSQWVRQPSSKEFCSLVNLTPRGVLWAFRKFLDHSVTEKLDQGYRIQDPLLYFYLRQTKK